MILKDCPTQRTLVLTAVPVPKNNVLRMQELGVRVGAHVVVAQHAGFGGVILNIAGSRVAIDHRWAKLIEAVPVEQTILSAEEK